MGIVTVDSISTIGKGVSGFELPQLRRGKQNASLAMVVTCESRAGGGRPNQSSISHAPILVLYRTVAMTLSGALRHLYQT